MLCVHDLWERKTACEEGMCPLCLAAERKREAAAAERYECPLGISNRGLCSAGTCVECRIDRAVAAEHEQCTAEIKRLQIGWTKESNARHAEREQCAAELNQLREILADREDEITRLREAVDIVAKAVTAERKRWARVCCDLGENYVSFGVGEYSIAHEHGVRSGCDMCADAIEKSHG